MISSLFGTLDRGSGGSVELDDRWEAGAVRQVRLLGPLLEVELGVLLYVVEVRCAVVAVPARLLVVGRAVLPRRVAQNLLPLGRLVRARRADVDAAGVAGNLARLGVPREGEVVAGHLGRHEEGAERCVAREGRLGRGEELALDVGHFRGPRWDARAPVFRADEEKLSKRGQGGHGWGGLLGLFFRTRLWCRDRFRRQVLRTVLREHKIENDHDSFKPQALLFYLQSEST